MKKVKHLQFLHVLMPFLFCCWAVFIFLLSSQSGRSSAGQSNALLKWLELLLPALADSALPLSLLLRKLAHFTEYAILGLTAAGTYCYTFKRDKKGTVILFLWLAGLTVACLDEQVVQRFLATDRGPSWLDVGIDLVGYSSGFYLVSQPFKKNKSAGRNS